ncbi:HlyD family type I secretion periplasmic adaptor subunit [uncultured Roseobacter sp.]|uniref:HlyD family type I secretion periplasmic adaptor subunit n=1 Tax=uncultured Roseobacter sp. TaxID=114847 RepID=UPI002601E0FE|nr:HlyD family type I secretion periplasmic adaptor subunit [uncultured Roseobacter sp.]
MASEPLGQVGVAAAKPPPADPFQPGRKTRLELDFLPEYLEITERPPAFGARFLIAAILTLCAAAVVWIFLGQIDIIASSQGRLIVDGRTKVVQAGEAGEIRAIHVRDGQKVRRGDPLVDLVSTSAEAEVARLETLIATADLEVARLRAMLAGQTLETFIPPDGVRQVDFQRAQDRFRADMVERRVNRQTRIEAIAQTDRRITAARAVLDRTTALADNVEVRLQSSAQLLQGGNLSRLRFIELEKEKIDQLRQIADVEATIVGLEADKARLRGELEQTDASWEKSLLDKIAEQTQAAEDTLQRLIPARETLRRLEVIAPSAGIIQEVAVNTLGAVVSPGQELMKIVPEDTQIEAEIMVLNRDVGFVSAGQSVQVKIDSFPYTRYGTIDGKVTTISRDSVADEQLGLVFPARVALAAQQIVYQDQTIPLNAGMSIVGEIRTGERRIIDYILSPLRQYQSEALRER